MSIHNKWDFFFVPKFYLDTKRKIKSTEIITWNLTSIFHFHKNGKLKSNTGIRFFFISRTWSLQLSNAYHCPDIRGRPQLSGQRPSSNNKTITAISSWTPSNISQWKRNNPYHTAKDCLLLKTIKYFCKRIFIYF